MFHQLLSHLLFYEFFDICDVYLVFPLRVFNSQIKNVHKNNWIHPYHQVSGNSCTRWCSGKTKSFQQPYQPLFEDHVSKPLEVQSFKGREDKQGLSLIAFCLLDGTLWIRDPHSGLGADIFLKAFHWGLI